jgi:hypothetical protein
VGNAGGPALRNAYDPGVGNADDPTLGKACGPEWGIIAALDTTLTGGQWGMIWP